MNTNLDTTFGRGAVTDCNSANEEDARTLEKTMEAVCEFETGLIFYTMK
jgi:hypothetical protein